MAGLAAEWSAQMGADRSSTDGPLRVVAEALRVQTLEAVGELRSLEVERLNSLQVAMWQKAMDGDVPSAMAVVRCIMSRCRLLGLDGPGLLRAEVLRPRTLVVPPVT